MEPDTPTAAQVHLSAEACEEQMAALLARDDLSRLAMAEHAIGLIRAATPWLGSQRQAETLAKKVADRLDDTWISFWMPAY